MGYKIQYSIRQKRKVVHIRLPLLILTFFFLFCLLVNAMWPKGAFYLEKLGLFTDSAVAVSALNDLADELRYGDGLIGIIGNLARMIKS